MALPWKINLSLVGVFLLMTLITFTIADKCPPPEDIMPCRCRGRNDQIQVWCSHSDLDRVNGALENLMRLRSLPAIDELIVENNRMPTLPARAFGALQIGRLLLRNNGLESVSRNAFAGLEDSVEEIYIVEEKLVDFPFDTIENLRNLEAFTIEKSKIRLLPRFNGLNRLKHIRIDGSHISGLPVGAFAQMANVKQIHVVNSNLVTLAEGIFGPLDHLLLANFSGNRIDSIQRRCFTLLNKLEVLSISHNNLQDSVSVGRAVETLGSLKSLDLSFNQFKQLPEGSFVNLRTLQMLNLSQNKIQSVSSRTFTHLPALRKVDLSYNELRNFPKMFFDSVPLLEELRMRKNALSSPNEIGEMLSTLASLRYLDLAENGLTELQTEAVANHMQLHKLDLSDNKITRIQRQAFSNVPSLAEMSLRNNSIKDLPSDGDAWDIPSLKELDISSNNLQLLPTNALKGLGKLAQLDMSHNSIKSISSGTFSNNKEIELLDMSANGLNSIAPDALNGLAKIQKLDLSRNHLDNLQSGIFRDLQNLETLNLANNRLSSVPSNLLTTLKSLLELSLKSNTISHIPPNFFGSQEKLRELNLKHNSIADIHSRMLGGLKSLETLKLASNQITRFDDSAFDDMLKLKMVDISSNRIQRLPSRSFKNLPSLEKLEARENRIGIVEDGAFANSDSVAIIDLAHNALTNIPSLDHITKSLKVMDLSHNQINKVEPTAFQKAYTLMELYLNDNKIKNLHPHTFENMSSISIIDLDGNELDEIQTQTFNNNPRLIYLRLSRNKIRTIRSAGFSHLTALDGVDLQENDLESVVENGFEKTGSLKYLNLSNNNFESVSKMGLYPLQSLEVLDVSYNRLRDISDKSLKHLLWLVELRMNDNGICDLPLGLFDGMSRLKMLVLRNNFIPRLYESVFYKLKNNIAFIDVSGNPLICDCELTWLRNMMARETVTELADSVCDLPNELKGNFVRAVRPGRMVCPTGITRGLPSTNQEKCPHLPTSRRRPKIPVETESKPLFGNNPVSDEFYAESENELNKNRKKDEKLIESNDYVAGDTPTIYASTINTDKKATLEDVKKSSNYGGGGLSSLFGIPLPGLDFGLSLGISPSISLLPDKHKHGNIHKVDDPRSFSNSGMKGPEPLPVGWIERPNRLDTHGKPNVYEPPEYIPRKPNQPYIPLNSYSESQPSPSADVHKVASPGNRRPLKFPSSPATSSTSWHPSYPNVETGFIPIEPFFHSSGGKGNTKKNAHNHIVKKNGTELSSASVNFFSTTGRPVPSLTSASSPESSPLSSTEEPEYEEEDVSYSPLDTQSTEETKRPSSTDDDFSLSDFWSMFTKDNSTESTDENEVPLNFSAPIDTLPFPNPSTARPSQLFTTTVRPDHNHHHDDDSPNYSASNQVPHDAHGRRPVGRPTITKLTLEETENVPFRNYINPAEHQHGQQQPLTPPVVIGSTEDNADWYYTNYHNHNPREELEKLEKYLEESRITENEGDVVDLKAAAEAAGISSIHRSIFNVWSLVLMGSLHIIIFTRNIIT